MNSYLRRWFLSLIVAVVVGLLGAIPLAHASGFAPQGFNAVHFNSHPADSTLVWACGAILFLLTLAVMGPITRAIAALIIHLSRTDTRPTPLAAATMIGSGTLLVFSSLYLAWSSASSPMNQLRNEIQGAVRSANAAGKSFNLSIPEDAFAGTGSGSGAMILTVLVFVLGTGLVALGVWASLPAGPPIKTPIPASDATSL